MAVQAVFDYIKSIPEEVDLIKPDSRISIRPFTFFPSDLDESW